jgi:hypothetical protein
MVEPIIIKGPDWLQRDGWMKDYSLARAPPPIAGGVAMSRKITVTRATPLSVPASSGPASVAARGRAV